MAEYQALLERILYRKYTSEINMKTTLEINKFSGLYDRFTHIVNILINWISHFIFFLGHEYLSFTCIISNSVFKKVQFRKLIFSKAIIFLLSFKNLLLCVSCDEFHTKTKKVVNLEHILQNVYWISQYFMPNYIYALNLLSTVEY